MNRALLVLALVAACGDNAVINRAPTANAFTLTTQEDLPVTRSVEATDLDGDVLEAAVPLPPDHGTVTVTGLSVTYTPAADYHGSDQFALVVSDGESEVSIVVDVTVTAVNDSPVGGADSLATNEDAARVVPVDQFLANDSDVDGDALAITAVAAAVTDPHGTVALANGNITYTPDANFVGGDSFTYTISDGTADTEISVSVVVAGLNDAPVANDDTVTTTEDTAITIPAATLLANDSDIDGQTLTISAVSGATGGTVALNGGSPIFTPAANSTTAGSFIYTVTDGIATDTATVTVNITAANDGPDAADDTASTDEDTAVTISVLANDTDPDGTTPTVTGVSNISGGTPVVNGNGTISFTPNANFHGSATFDYTITDGTLTDTATVTVTVAAVNDLPVAVDDSGSTPLGTPITFSDLAANDTDVDIATDGQTLSVTAVANAVNGTVVLVGGDATFTPTGVGTGSFEYTVSDGNGGTDTGLVTIAITQANVIPPTANPDGLSAIDVPTAFPHSALLANDSDGGDGGSFAIVSVSNATNGSVTLEATTVTFTPTPGFVGDATFQYELSDGNAITSTATVTIAVSDCGDGIPQGIESCDDDNNTAGDGCSATCTTEIGFTCSNQTSPSVCAQTTLASFSFTGQPGTEVTLAAQVANGLAAPVLSRGSGVSPAAAANSMSSNGWTQVASVDLADFYALTITPDAGDTMSLFQVQFQERRSSSGPTQFVVRSSLDGFTSDLLAGSPAETDTVRTLVLPAAFQNITTEVEFRIFGFNSGAGSGTWRLNGTLSILGGVSP